jgi:hypothetical protein
MSEVIATNVVKQQNGYRFIAGLFGKQILQISSVCQDWDTNSGYDSGPEYTSWRNATRWEAENFLREKAEQCQ